MKRLYLVLLFALSMQVVFAQKPIEIKIQCPANANEFLLTTYEEKGVLLIYSEVNGKIKEILFTKYNTDLEEIDQVGEKFPSNYDINEFYVDEEDDKIYLMVGVSRHFSIVEYDMNNGNISTHDGTLPERITIKNFLVSDGMVYFVAHDRVSALEISANCCLAYIHLGTCGLTYLLFNQKFEEKPIIMSFDLASEEINVVKEKYKGNTDVIGSTLIKAVTPTLRVYLNTNYKNENTALMKDYVYDGELTDEEEIRFPSTKQLLTVQHTELDDTNTALIGTYKNYKTGKKKIVRSGRTEASAEGLYFSRFEEGDQKYIKFYEFVDFEGFTDFYPETYQKALKKRVEKKKKKGKEVAVSVNINLHEIIRQDSNYILIGEIFFPHYERHCYQSYDSKTGTTTTECNYVLVGYYFTHALIAAFDKNGEIVWNNSFELTSDLTWDLSRRICSRVYEDEILLVYAQGNEIFSKIIKGDKVVKRKSSDVIEKRKKNSKVKTVELSSGVSHLYDNYFLVHKYEDFKDKSKKRGSGERKGRTYYFSKIYFNR